MEAYAYAGIREQRRSGGGGAVALRRRAAGRGGFTLTAAAAPAKGAKGGKGAVAAAPAPVKADVRAVLKKASATAFRGGVAGFAAGVLQARPAARS
jgi:hypothetical protein